MFDLFCKQYCYPFFELTNYRTAQAPVDGLDVETGIFTAPSEGKYMVTLTA
jgi:hypothetical protein